MYGRMEIENDLVSIIIAILPRCFHRDFCNTETISILLREFRLVGREKTGRV